MARNKIFIDPNPYLSGRSVCVLREAGMLFLPSIRQRAGELRSGPLSCATCEAVVCPSLALRLGNYRALATGYGDCACQPFSSAAVLAARQLGAVRPGERHGQLGS